MPEIEVLYEDNHLLVLNKPAGIATMGAPQGQTTLLALAKAYIKRRYHKPGNVYLGVVSRLDKPVSGVIVFARTSKAARRLNEQQAKGRFEKIYWCLVPRLPGGKCEGALVDWLCRDERAKRMAVCAPHAPGATEARATFRHLRAWGRYQLLEVELETGRKHQIRVQLASRGCPIVGDRKYGSTAMFSPGIALHAHRLTLEHPVRRTRMTWTSEPAWPAARR